MYRYVILNRLLFFKLKEDKNKKCLIYLSECQMHNLLEHVQFFFDECVSSF